MTKPSITITDSNIQNVREYLQKQMDTHTWWPTEQPGLAKDEFKLMQGSVGSLEVWCKKWLNSSQLGQLEKQCREG